MRTRTLAGTLLLAVGFSLAGPGSADAQILKRVKQAAREAAVGEAANQVDRLIREATPSATRRRRPPGRT